MTKFTKDNVELSRGGGETWIYYVTPERCRQFVARFKVRGAGHFKAFLIKNFTVEEYFDLYKDGAGLPPQKILETKGYISVQHAEAMRRLGVTDHSKLGAALVAEYDRNRAEREAREAQPLRLVTVRI